MDLMTGRQAATVLAEVGLSRSQARRLLATGLAGDPLRTTAATLYDGSRVRSLLDWPSVDPFALPEPCDRALLLLRGATRVEDSSSSLALANAGAFVRTQVRVLVARHGFVPLVATCASFVTGLAEVVEVTARTKTAAELGLRPAGAWSTAFVARRIYSPGGNHWTLYGDHAAV